MHQATLLAALAASLSALPGVQAGLYTKNSPVLQLDARSYTRLIAESNHTSIVEFYAPWCGHCQNLKPAYEKAAKSLAGLAKVAAIDCDEESNKAFCGSMNVQGFPTLKIIRPGKKPGKPVVEGYNGARTAAGITEAVAARINNHVKRLADADVDGFLAGGGPKALLFTEKGTTSALLKSVAIDFLGVVGLGQVRDKEKATVERFGIKEFPKFVLVPGEGQDPIVYEGELKKQGLVDFLKQAGEPNPDPAPTTGAAKEKKKKADKKTDKKKAESKPADESKTAETSSSTAETESSSIAAAAPEHTLIHIPAIDQAQLEKECLQPKSLTCVLALVPTERTDTSDKAIHSLDQLNTKYLHGKQHTFPFYSLADDLQGSKRLREALGLTWKVEIIVINARRGWWSRYEGGMGVHSVEAFLDAIRLGEGEKAKLPREVIVEAAAPSAEEGAEIETTPEPQPSTSTETETETKAGEHDEL